MRILLVGKTGVFDTLAVAYGYLRMDIQACPYLGDLGLENRKGLIKVGTDPQGTEIFIVGFNVPQIVCTINHEIKSISNIKDEEQLLVFPLSIVGETFSWVIARLASIPLIGTMFIRWAKSRTLRRASYLTELGRNLNIANQLMKKDNEGFIYAAKPYKK
jgi:hypothetical protein